MNSKPIVLVVAGHGGLNALGEYPRKDKRSPQVPPGIYEGAWNRKAAEAITRALEAAGIRAQFVNPGPVNQPLKSIIGYVNDTCRRANVPICVFEVHANSEAVEHYDERGWGDARGVVQFVSKRASSTSQKLAHEYDKQLQELGYAIPSRGVKAANFAIITRTSCPAWLLEAGFMSNYQDVELLQQEDQIGILCQAAVNTIKTVYAVE